MFKAVLTSVAVIQDFDTNKRSVEIGTVIIPEPKINALMYKSAQSVEVTDNLGKKSKGISRYRSNWQYSRDGLISFNRNWQKISVGTVSDNAVTISSLSFEVPVRIIKQVDKIMFKDAIKAKIPLEKPAGKLKVALTSFELKGGKVMAKVKISGKELPSWGSCKWNLEQNGKNLGELYPRRSESFPNARVFHIQSSGILNLKKDKPMDLAVTLPGKTLETKLKFNFKDIPLPVAREK